MICYNLLPTTTKRRGASCQVPSSVKQVAVHLNYVHLLVWLLEGGGGAHMWPIVEQRFVLFNILFKSKTREGSR